MTKLQDLNVGDRAVILVRRSVKVTGKVGVDLVYAKDLDSDRVLHYIAGDPAIQSVELLPVPTVPFRRGDIVRIRDTSILSGVRIRTETGWVDETGRIKGIAGTGRKLLNGETEEKLLTADDKFYAKQLVVMRGGLRVE